MPNENLNPASVRELILATGPCSTLVFEGSPPAIANLSPAARKAIAELPSTGATPRKVAVLQSAEHLVVSHVDDSIEPISNSGNGFDVRTVLQIAAAQRAFYILALSQNRSRLLACTQDRAEEVPFPIGTSTSVADFSPTDDPGNDSMGPAGSSNGRENKNQYLLHLFRGLDRAVNAILKDKSEPLIIAGVEHEIALYRSVASYPNTLDGAVHGSPDAFEGGEMHARALEILDMSAVEYLKDFDKKAGTGHASIHIQEIVAAAYEGRIAHLFFQAAARHEGSFDPVRRKVRHASDETADLIENSATEAIRHGGDARILPASRMPHGAPVCAIFRYAAAVSPAA